MKALWLKHSARIDALSLRERAFLFISLIAVCVALANVLWLAPAQKAHEQTRLRVAAQSAELLRLRSELQGSVQPVDASKSVRNDLAAAQAELNTINQEILNTKAPTADSGLALEQVLVQFLRRQEGLTLLSTGTVAGSSEAAATGAGAAAPSVLPGLLKRGMELKVAGPYPALVRYVKTLEGALPGLRWGSLQLKSDKQPPELTMQVFVVEVQP